MSWLLSRLSEKTTWYGFVSLGLSAVVAAHPELTPAVVIIAGLFHGAVKVVTPEKK